MQKHDWYNQDHLGHIKKRRRRIIGASVVLSIVLHLLSFVNLDTLAYRFNMSKSSKEQSPVKINIVSKKFDDIPSDSRNKIADTRQAKTEPPKLPKYNSYEDHRTEKETRVKESKNARGKNAGEAGTAQDAAVAKSSQNKANQTTPSLSMISPTGTFAVNQEQDKRRKERYKSLLPSAKDLRGIADAGYQEKLSEDIDLGDRIDINTSEFRYMGYFTGMRKAIELVWNYPTEAAQRGMQGVVGVEFVIQKSGSVSRIKVIKSSGYKILDDAIVEALRLASPFSPLPDGFGKQRMLITGSFRYVLSPYVAGAH